ncbi:maltose acetyltransferase domain-containing protein [Vibrio vulnificus]|uniref:maltose acetyltransferase domain-containing protein n=1 Tax=Vibrio vulnificus TaxID=672 RepID=UPI000A48439B|nr:maltose acetyltransferase domain-containing protein [Vibrio vulnificus]
MTEFEKMNSGQIFDGADAEIDAIRNRAAVLLKEINAATETEQRIALRSAKLPVTRLLD